MNTLKIIPIVFFLCLSILLTSCPGKDGPASPECEKKWFANKKNLATISNGNLELKCDNQDSVLVITTFNPQTRKINLQGDFEISMNFEEFKPGIFNSKSFSISDQYGTGLTLFISSSDKINQGYVSLSKNALAAFTTNKSDYLSQYALIDSTDAIKSGNFNIKRTGPMIKFTVSVGGKSYSLSDSLFGNADVYFTASLYCITNSKTDLTSIKINDFNITGGGGTLKSDSFDCNSLE